MIHSAAPVTVIVPCRNAAETLGDAVESALNQTTAPIEVLVIDDRSTDRSAAVARSFDSRVRVLLNPQRGPSAARRLGVIEARGTYIAFVDADDLVEPTKHEQQLAVLENGDPHTLVHTGTIAFWPDGSRPDLLRPGAEQAVGRCTRVVFERNPVCGASIMLRRSVILELGNYDPELFVSEDFGLLLAASTCCDFVYLPGPLYRTRRGVNNVTSRSSLMACCHWLAQEKFRLTHPDAFAQLPPQSVWQYMVEPVLRVAREAYWRRDATDYARLLRLAISLAPGDPGIRQLWRRRWVPMAALRTWDRLRERAAGFSPRGFANAWRSRTRTNGRAG